VQHPWLCDVSRVSLPWLRERLAPVPSRSEGLASDVRCELREKSLRCGGRRPSGAPTGLR